MSEAMHKPLEGATSTPTGIMLNGILMQPSVEQCIGCNYVRDFGSNTYCSTYPMPARKWALGVCNFATNLKIETAKQAKVNPLKASKRAAKGR